MDKSKKVALTIASSILILIALSAVGFFVWYQYMNANYHLSHGSIEEVVNIAVQKNNPGECGKIKAIFIDKFMMSESEETLIDSCYYQVAYALHDEKVCNYISDSVDTAVGHCVTDIAVSKNDITSCQIIKNQFGKGICYGAFIEQGADMSVCENIDSSSMGRDFSGRDYCYMRAVQAKPDISICTTKIQTEHYKNSCYKVVAIATKNPTLCDKIQGQYTQFDRDDCKRYIRETTN